MCIFYVSDRTALAAYQKTNIEFHFNFMLHRILPYISSNDKIRTKEFHNQFFNPIFLDLSGSGDKARSSEDQLSYSFNIFPHEQKFF